MSAQTRVSKELFLTLLYTKIVFGDNCYLANQKHYKNGQGI